MTQRFGRFVYTPHALSAPIKHTMGDEKDTPRCRQAVLRVNTRRASQCRNPAHHYDTATGMMFCHKHKDLKP